MAGDQGGFAPYVRIRDRIQQRASQDQRCPVCMRPVDRFSTFCEAHGAAKRRTGSPHGHRLRLADLAPYLAHVAPWLVRNRQHPDIVGAADWIARRLEEGRQDVELRPSAGLSGTAS